jgi:hypothetical protein
VHAFAIAIQAATGRLGPLTNKQIAILDRKFSPAIVRAVQRGRLVGKKLPGLGRMPIALKRLYQAFGESRGMSPRKVARIYERHRLDMNSRFSVLLVQRRRLADRALLLRRGCSTAEAIFEQVTRNNDQQASKGT